MLQYGWPWIYWGMLKKSAKNAYSRWLNRGMWYSLLHKQEAKQQVDNRTLNREHFQWRSNRKHLRQWSGEKQGNMLCWDQLEACRGSQLWEKGKWTTPHWYRFPPQTSAILAIVESQPLWVLRLTRSCLEITWQHCLRKGIHTGFHTATKSSAAIARCHLESLVPTRRPPTLGPNSLFISVFLNPSWYPLPTAGCHFWLLLPGMNHEPLSVTPQPLVVGTPHIYKCHEMLFCPKPPTGTKVFMPQLPVYGCCHWKQLCPPQ